MVKSCFMHFWVFALVLCLKLQDFHSEILTILWKKQSFLSDKERHETALSLSLSVSMSLSPSVSAAICTHVPSQPLRITKVFFFKASPFHLLWRVCSYGSRQGGGNFLGLVPLALRPLPPVACLLGRIPLTVS